MLGGNTLASAEAEQVLQQLMAERGAPMPPLAQRRREWLERAEAEPLPAGTKTSAVEAGGVIADWVEHPDCDGEGVFLLLHGGGFNAGSPVTHHKFASYLSQATNMKVLVPDYRLAPEHPFPAALHDCLAVYGALLSETGETDQIAIGGDSAGGGLVASLLVAIRDAGGPLPSSATLLSPWLDLTNSGKSYTDNAESDPQISKARHDEMGPLYFGEADPSHPLISPAFADPKGFPPTLIQVGDIETMLSDSTDFAAKAEKAGVDVELQVWPNMWHVWHQNAPDVPEAMEAFSKIGDFVRKHAGG